MENVWVKKSSGQITNGKITPCEGSSLPRAYRRRPSSALYVSQARLSSNPGVAVSLSLSCLDPLNGKNKTSALTSSVEEVIQIANLINSPVSRTS